MSALNPPVDAIRYTGPLTMPNSGALNVLVNTQRLTTRATVSSTAGGNLNFQIIIDPTILDQWSSLKGLYQEMRPLAFKCTYVPRFPAWGTTSAQALIVGPIVWYVDRDSTTGTPTDPQVGWRNAGAQVKSVNQRFVATWRMNSTNECSWGNTSTASYPIAKVSMSGGTGALSASSTYGDVFVELLCQFRANQ
jgi:hypothetical protein